MTDKKEVVEINDSLKKELEKFRKKRGFDADKWIDQKTDMFNDYMKKFGLKGCVVNVSGGVDSSVTLALMIKASKKPGSPIKKVLGVSQPIHSTKKIYSRAYEIGKALGAEIITVDQTKVFDSLIDICDKSTGIKGKPFSTGQMKSYMRTPVVFYVCQTLCQEGIPSIVIGTGNFDEDGYLYYFCKAGDGISDVQLINDLHKSEVFQVGKKLNVPESILGAPPSADLWDGQTDEEELGFTYEFVELYTEYLKNNPKKEDKEKWKKNLDEKSLKIFEDLEKKASSVHRRNSHKAKYPFNINIFPTLEE